MLRFIGNQTTKTSKFMTYGNSFKFQGVRYSSAHAAVKVDKDRKNGHSNTSYKVGDVCNGFVCTDVKHIKAFNMTAIRLQHEKSKTDYLHLQRDDSNNVFSINFRTTPFDSTGLPHILEHTVLCGSKQYPVRDPFFKMINRSLATFMNAMTGADYTFYPFSSQNEVDYRNLQSIYLDAVFNPNLNYMDFLQEGWRLEHSELEDPKSDLIFKGVVFNEMKGAFAENHSVFGEAFINNILPDHTYGYISGGDPLDIPNLTHQNLKDFHKKYYHPSNARLYSYGNFPLERNLEICDKLYLSHCEGIDSSYSCVPSQTRWSHPVEKQIRCRFDKMGLPIEKQNQIAVGFLTCDITNIYETFVLYVLSELLVMGPNSPFYKSLIEPNISGGFSRMTGYLSQMKDTMFLIGLQDLEVNKFKDVQSIISETFKNITNKGFEKKHIESVLHNIELGIKHQHTRFGLNTLFNLVPLWNHEGSLADGLDVVKSLNKLKSDLKDPHFLSGKVEEYFVKNNHRLTLTMVPDEHFEEQMNLREKELLQKKISGLTENDRKSIFDNGLKLAESQKKHQNLDALPCLNFNDIPKSIEIHSYKSNQFDNIPVQVCEANTNGVTYFKGVLNISDLPKNLQMLVPLFNATVTNMDMSKHNYREFDQLISLKTGGLNFSTHISEKISEPWNYEEGVLIGSHALDENVGEMFNIWKEVFEKPKYQNVDRLKMLLDNYMSNLTNGIADCGHLYAMQSANSLVSSCSLLKEDIGGLRHIEFMKSLCKNNSIEEIANELTLIAGCLLSGSRLRSAINLSSDNSNTALSEYKQFCHIIPKSDSLSNERLFTEGEHFRGPTQCLHHVVNIPVNFCAKSVYTVPFTHPDFAKLRILAKFLSSKYLHPVVREQNGAYGGGAKLGNDGLFCFYSYRDPNSRVTLDVFDESENWFKSKYAELLTDQNLFEAKLGVLQQIDSPIAEFNKGIDYFLHGIDRKMLQQHRSDVLSVTKQDLIEVCSKYLSNERDGPNVGKCVIGLGKNSVGEKDLYKDNEIWRVVEPNSDQ